MSQVPHIQLIHEDSHYFPEVVALGDQQQEIFRFQRRPIYERYAKNPGILVALWGQDLAGYIMWSLNTKKKEVRIWQLCVKPQYRGQKIAQSLHDKVIEYTQADMRRIRLECLADYGLDGMWKKFGYKCVLSKDARTKNDTLNVWIMEYSHPEYRSIFDTDSEEPKFAIDAKTLHLLLQDQSNSKDLLGWLGIGMKICVTDEIYNEISENYSSETRKNLWGEAQAHFLTRSCEILTFQEYVTKIGNFVEKHNLDLNETCIRHVARCAAAGVPYFITSWNELLKISAEVYVNFGVRSITYEQSLDIQKNSAVYLKHPPILLAHNAFEKKTMSLADVSEISSIVHKINPSQELLEISEKLTIFVSDEEFYCSILSYNDKPYVCLVERVLNANCLTVPFFKVLDRSILAKSIGSYVIDRLLQKSIAQNLSQVIITDHNLSELDQDILKAEYFIQGSGSSDLIKLCPRATMSSNEVLDYLQKIPSDIPAYSKASEVLCDQLSASDFGEYPSRSLDVERILWPLKISDAGLSSFIIPIKPEAAKELFDENLAQENLFGVYNPSLFINLESVYYKSKQSPKGMKQAPYRVLWYVSQSKDKGYTQQLSSVRACSQVDQVIFGQPEELYEKFQNLGFYSLDQVRSCSSNASGEVMAIKFSHTELFQSPVSLSQIAQITSRKIVPQSPILIEPEHFIQIYRLGFNIS